MGSKIFNWDYLLKFLGPNKENEQKLQIKSTLVKEKLWEAVPPPVKELLWRKAANTELEQLLLLGKKTFIWSYHALDVIQMNLFSQNNPSCFAANNGGIEWCARLNLEV
ncbi:unnamed protein product [Malus baccata var. baccata]